MLLSNRNKVSLLSDMVNIYSSKLFIGGIRFPSFLNSEHLYLNLIATLNSIPIPLICLSSRNLQRRQIKFCFCIIKYPFTDQINNNKFIVPLDLISSQQPVNRNIIFITHLTYLTINTKLKLVEIRNSTWIPVMSLRVKRFIFPPYRNIVLVHR